MPERQPMTTRLKTLFQRPELFVLAGGINPIGAKMAEALGYDAFYMSGGNTSAHQRAGPTRRPIEFLEQTPPADAEASHRPLV